MNDLAPPTAVLTLAAMACSPSSGPGEAVDLVVTAAELELLAPTLVLSDVREMSLAGGSLWILDAEAPFLSRVSLGSGETVSFGERGEGPGELLNPLVLLPEPGASGARIHVWDYGSGRVVTFDSAGALASSEPMDNVGSVMVRVDMDEITFADPLRVRSDGAGLLVARFPGRVDRPSDFLAGSLHRADRTLALGPALTRFHDLARGSQELNRVWGPLPLWDACDGRVVLWSPDSSRVIWMDPAGAPLESAAVDLEPPPVETSDVERYLRHMARRELGPDYEGAGIDFAAQARARRELFAETAPLATDLRCEAAGVAWLQLFGTEVDPVGRGGTWVRVSTGEPPLRVTFPPEFTPGHFGPDGVHGTLLDTRGLQRPAHWSGSGSSTPLLTEDQEVPPCAED